MLAALTRFWLVLGDADQAEIWQQRADAIGAGQPIPILGRMSLYKYREQHALAKNLIKQTLDRNIEPRFGSDFTLRQAWAFEMARTGDYQAALEPYRASHPWAFSTPLELPENVQDQFGDIIQIAGLMKLAEPLSNRHLQLLEIAKKYADHGKPGWGTWNSDVANAQIAAVRGEPDVALDWLNSAWDKNMRIGLRRILKEDAIISQLAGQPRYQELLARYESDMQRQRIEAYELMGISK
jgi:hypothetical protein